MTNRLDCRAEPSQHEVNLAQKGQSLQHHLQLQASRTKTGEQRLRESFCGNQSNSLFTTDYSHELYPIPVRTSNWRRFHWIHIAQGCYLANLCYGGLWNCLSAVKKADPILAFASLQTLHFLSLTKTWITPENSLRQTGLLEKLCSPEFITFFSTFDLTLAPFPPTHQEPTRSCLHKVLLQNLGTLRHPTYCV